jgi:hypothetical protein
MSLMMDTTDLDCQLTLTEIRMRVANIKSQWSDEERAERANQGYSRRQQLAALVEEALPDTLLDTILETVRASEAATCPGDAGEDWATACHYALSEV